MTTARKKDLAVLVRREDDGKVYSEIRDRLADPHLYRTGEPPITVAVTIDRQRGNRLDMETVCNRAKYLSELLGIPYDEDLTQVCLARRGLFCTCPDCVAKTKAARR